MKSLSKWGSLIRNNQSASKSCLDKHISLKNFIKNNMNIIKIIKNIIHLKRSGHKINIPVLKKIVNNEILLALINSNDFESYNLEINKITSEINPSFNINNTNYIYRLINMVVDKGDIFYDKNYWNSINLFLKKNFSIYDEILNSSEVKKSEKLLDFKYKSINYAKYSIDMYIRKKWWENDKRTRDHELGSRVHRAFSAFGANCRLFEPSIQQIKRINSHEHQSPVPKIAFVDLQCLIFNNETEKVEFLEFIFDRYDLVVGLLLDYWNFKTDTIPRGFLDLFAAFWTYGPDYEKLSNIRSKIFDFPFPLGLDENSLSAIRGRSAINEIQFRGGIEVTNYSRLFWAAAASSKNSMRFKLGSNHEDGLNADVSYSNYLNDLASSECCLNFSRRRDGTKSITGRVHEVLALSRILFNEDCSSIGRFYARDLHYFEFSNIDGLVALSDEYKNNPNKFALVRKELLGFHDSRYSDLKIGEALAYKLDL